MLLRKLNVANKEECEFLDKLYVESFPETERRSVLEMHKLLAEEPVFNINMLVEDNQVVGFITHWEFDSFVYAEHLAVNPQIRGRGLGKLAVYAFLEMINKPIIMEVETPYDEMSERRIGFYKRIGLTIWDKIPYAQPSFVPDDDPVPMYIMTPSNVDLNEKWDEYKKILFDKVYHIKL